MKIFGNKIYEKNFKNNWGGKYPSEEVIRFYNYVKNIVNKKLIGLDIGCGRGACAWFMAKEGMLVTAFDGAPSGLNKVNTLANIIVLLCCERNTTHISILLSYE